ncbi:ATP-dependent helicase NAM7 [Purpureocillium lavendulum]|uniref:ATP-dependent helicase NAM7 n=1 Tax=Purpureocillium lavendulum TaxID=1247861 RepID=A0AB34FPJ2_9HYPO|nr:ATP-dependent helicase NAM7 [Purpureocillium lavendulum]
MQIKKFGLAIALAATMGQPGEASIGKAADLLCQFFCQGIADLFVNIFSKRDIDPAFLDTRSIMGRAPPGVPQQEFDRCYDQMRGVSVNADSPGAGRKSSLRQEFISRCMNLTKYPTEVRFMGVPPACMNLANVLVGDPVNGPYALPCGSDCLSYTDLDEQQFNELVDKLNAAAS